MHQGHIDFGASSLITALTRLSIRDLSSLRKYDLLYLFDVPLGLLTLVYQNIRWMMNSQKPNATLLYYFIREGGIKFDFLQVVFLKNKVDNELSQKYHELWLMGLKFDLKIRKTIFHLGVLRVTNFLVPQGQAFYDIGLIKFTMSLTVRLNFRDQLARGSVG